ncbi:MAG: phosphate starvation-inducible protein PsiF, partial [Burkholderiales bacterium]|nr:phosphate starvation-inducible protein PsiF [Burkholderiales bacterium]
MRSLCLALCMGLVMTPAVMAADAKSDKELTPQQLRMKECNQRASDMKGDERKSFMSACLAGKEPEKMTQQEKMKVCNQKAADMKGDERK